MKADLGLVKRLALAVRPYKAAMAISLLAMIAAAALEPVLPALLKPLVDQSLIAKDSAAMWQVPLLLLLAFLAKGLAEYVANVASQWVANRAIHDLRQQVFAHQMRLPLATHLQQTQARMLSRLLYDIPQVGAALASAWVIVIRDLLVITGLLAYLVWTAWQLTLLILAIAPLAAWLIQAASRKLRGGNQAIQDTTAHMTGVIEENLRGVREVKLFDGYAHEGQRFAHISDLLRRQTMRAVRVAALNVPLVQVLAAAAVSAVIALATQLSAQDQLSPGAFVAYVAAMAMIFEPMRRLTNINPVIQKGLAGAQSLYALLDLPSESGTPQAAAAATSASPLPLRLRGVSFRYPGQDDWALRDLDLDVPAGKTIALVGASGSGKTTLINLIARFFDPDRGCIMLDGRDIRDLPLRQLRSQIAWVGQDVVLFDASIAENIAYGHSQARPTAIEAAARQANAWDFIAQLPDGLQQRIGNNGGQLSGGQRQRLAIARAFYKNAPILLLDEATSALDNAAEHAVKQALARLRQQRTVVVVAHRLSTVADADLIVVLERGRIVETGRHADLATAGGAYQGLLQSGHELRDDANADTPSPP